ncbi:fumarylacetoacetate hydrolase family protein [Sphingobium sp. WCS2017Hpa-17]|uniref:fumarylacetoacetate hydrolase family protein n=1 Tax=Sphingobium sp. WCS2017Hpa-17 TaxID=3073638 RepID=UPI00288C575D|nr:fumarylacetoacetate hydrolase family protein [Sphingobium sp. WCS2017Hpa-17]
MKLATFTTREGGPRELGLVEGDGLISLSSLDEAPTAMIALMADWGRWQEAVRSLQGTSATYALDDVHLHAPVPRPGKIMGLGLNYSDHVAEARIEMPKDQLWFAMQATTVNDPYGTIQLPRVSTSLDYEGELVFIIGKTIRHATRAQAKDAIFGFACGNDVSVRDWQFKTSQFNLGKSFDSHAPFGPWIVTADAIDPHALDIRSFVNGEQRQGSNTRHFIYDCYDQVAYLSQAMTLEPGDIFFTGTPGGIGSAMKPPRWLGDGDVVRVEIEGIGAIENIVRPE